MIILAGAAGGWIAFAGKNALYVIAQLLIVIGVVLQDVIADAMTTEVVERVQPDGAPRPKAEVDRELGMVQVLGRLALWSGILSVAGLSGWLAQIYSYETVFLLGLAVPAVSLTGALLVRLDGTAPRPIDWRILGGGLLFGFTVVAIGLSGLPLGQELVFAISLAVIALMLARIAGDLDEAHRRRIFYAALVIFLTVRFRGWGRAIGGSPSTCSASTRPSMARSRKLARLSVSPAPGSFRCHHQEADCDGVAVADRHRHDAVLAEHRACAPG